MSDFEQFETTRRKLSRAAEVAMLVVDDIFWRHHKVYVA